MTTRVLATPGPSARPFGGAALVLLTSSYAFSCAILWLEAEPLRAFVPHGALVGHIVLVFVWRRGEIVRDRERVGTVRQVLAMKGRASVRRRRAALRVERRASGRSGEFQRRAEARSVRYARLLGVQ